MQQLNEASHRNGGGRIAQLIGSSQPDPEETARALRGDYLLVYLSPEKLSESSRVRESMHALREQGRLALVAVDEAHCCCDWGHDFRTVCTHASYLTKPHRTVPYRTVPYLYLTLPNISLPYLTYLSYRAVPYRTLPYLIITYLIVRTLPYRTLQFTF